ncbi:MAG: KH domain-containing protein [Clostridia bacterium]|nr:KH domain-containing protein [Clostridia bacterium]
MRELVEYLVSSLIGGDKEFDVSINEEERTIYVHVDKEDIGKVIGRAGKIAKAIRVIVKAAATKVNKRYNVEIIER